MPTAIYDNCPQDWIGFSNKCYFFSDFTTNSTDGQRLCKINASDLARFDNKAELVRKIYIVLSSNEKLNADKISVPYRISY